jgi:hypothetical protein
MPFFLKDRDISADIAEVDSVLIVPCRFCPAASLAVREKKPYLELFRTFLRTAAYEKHIKKRKSQLEQAGIKASVFDSKLPHQFVVCMWTSRRRQELRRRASEYDAVMVLGCDAAVKAARDCTQSTSCKVISGMEVDGIMNVMPSIQFPGKISLEVTGVTRVLEHPSGTAEQEVPADVTVPRRSPLTTPQEAGAKR